LHAVIAIFRMDSPGEENLRILREGIVPRVSQEDGFVAGYWTHDGERAHNILVFESLEAAEVRAEDVRGNAANQAAAGLAVERITVAEVIAHA
jgi:hypothetical protein